MSHLTPEDVLADLLALLPGHGVALRLGHSPALLLRHRHTLLPVGNMWETFGEYVGNKSEHVRTNQSESEALPWDLLTLSLLNVGTDLSGDSATLLLGHLPTHRDRD